MLGINNWGDAAAATAVFVAAVAVLGFILRIFIVPPIKKWIETQIAEPLRTSNGHTVGEYVEDAAAKLESLASGLADVQEKQAEIAQVAEINAVRSSDALNRSTDALARAQNAERLAMATAEQLRQHKIGHP